LVLASTRARTLPRLVDEVRASHPGIEVELLPSAGEYRADGSDGRYRTGLKLAAAQAARFFSAKQA
jgi:hypothetical protein